MDQERPTQGASSAPELPPAPPPVSLRHLFAAPFRGGPWEHWGSYDETRDVTEEMLDIRLSEMVATQICSATASDTLLTALNAATADANVLTGSTAHAETVARHNAPKERKCLTCKAPFHSKSAGERVCRRCKSSSNWREGAGPSPAHSRRR